MSGFTKHQFENDIKNTKTAFTKYLKLVSEVLPCDYSNADILKLLKEYFPFEYRILNEKYEYYNKKDHSLKNRKGNTRFNMQTPEDIIQNIDIYKKMTSSEYRKNYSINYSDTRLQENIRNLKATREPKISRIQNKIDHATLKTQQVEPIFLDELIGLYDRKNTTQKDKVYIFNELNKYYNTKIINFYKKKVDTEYNRQLREMAFKHLQNLMHFAPPLRKQKYMRVPSDNKNRRKILKEVYAFETYKLSNIPQELEYRIENSKEQKIKSYDYFISHSSKDYGQVQEMITHLNNNKKNIYCDWINDTDYLKRHLVGNATKKIIETRIEQSSNILLIKSENSHNSIWVKYELNYAHSKGKKIKYIEKADIANKVFNLIEMDTKHFLDINYINYELF